MTAAEQLAGAVTVAHGEIVMGDGCSDQARSVLEVAVDAYRAEHPDEGGPQADALAVADAILGGQTSGLDLAPIVRQLERFAAAGDARNSLDHAAAFAQVKHRAAGTYESALADLHDNGASRREIAQLEKAVNGELRVLRQKAKADAVAKDHDGLPRLVVNNRPDRHVSSEAKAILEAANRTDPSLFVRSGSLVRVRADERGRHTIERVGPAQLSYLVGLVANCVRETEGGSKDVHPTDQLVSDLLVLDGWHLPPIEAIVESPVLRADGTVLVAKGYDRDARVFHAPAPGLTVPTVPDEPTAADIAAARALVDEAIGGFPFVRDRDEPGPGASYAGAVALLLTAIVRPAIAGAVPMAIVSAPQAGTGKSLLLDLCAVIATGRPAAMLGVEREEEMSKILFAVLREAPVLVPFDNLDGLLRSSALARAITAKTFSARILSESATDEFPVRATWVLTGNNVRLGGDLPRRTYVIGLDAKHARPWQRDGDFKHPELLPWATDNRGQLIGALLTLARAWFAAGQPAAPTPRLGGFEDWARIIGGILHHVGIGGFLTDLDKHYEQADEEAAEWETFLRAWHYTHGDATVLVKTIAASVQNESAALRDALPADLADLLTKPGVSFVRRLGKALSKRADRRYGDDGIHVHPAGKDDKGTVQWRVVIPDTATERPLPVSGFPGLVPTEASKIGSPTGGVGEGNTGEAAAPKPAKPETGDREASPWTP